MQSRGAAAGEIVRRAPVSPVVAQRLAVKRHNTPKSGVLTVWLTPRGFLFTYLKIQGITRRIYTCKFEALQQGGCTVAKKRTNPDFLNGVPELVVLRLLSVQAMYGYELVDAIRQQSGQQFEFGEGCIYPMLHKLEAAKLLSSRREKVNGRERVFYRTTAAGKKKLQASVGEWNRIAQAIALVLEGDGHDVSYA